MTCVEEVMALTAGGRHNRNSKTLAFALEKDGHLQLRRHDVPFYIKGTAGRPHPLRDHRPPVHDAAVK